MTHLVMQLIGIDYQSSFDKTPPKLASADKDLSRIVELIKRQGLTFSDELPPPFFPTSKSLFARALEVAPIANPDCWKDHSVKDGNMNQAQKDAMIVWDGCYKRVSGKYLIPITGVLADEMQKELLQALTEKPKGVYEFVCISRPESLRNNIPDDFDDWWIIPKEDFRWNEDYMSLQLLPS